MCGVEISAHIDALERDGALLADAAEAAGLQAGIPGCPGWQVRDLVRHQAYVHAWAARHVRERSPVLIDDELTESDILGRGPADPGLIAAYRDGHAALVATLRDADPDLECATFMPAPSPLAFWARRQAHETAIHRADAETALGGLPDFPAAFAADGIDELIMGFGRRRKYRPAAGQDGVLQVHATDTADCWYADIRDGRVQARREPGPADCTVSGSAARVYLYLWNRADATRAAVTVDGDPAVLARWRSGVRVRWE